MRKKVVFIKIHARFINSKKKVYSSLKEKEMIKECFLDIVLKSKSYWTTPNEFKSPSDGRREKHASKGDKIPEADSLKFSNRNGAYVERHLEFQSRANGSFEALILDSRT